MPREVCTNHDNLRTEVFGMRIEAFGMRIEVFGMRTEVFGMRTKVFGLGRLGLYKDRTVLTCITSEAGSSVVNL